MVTFGKSFTPSLPLKKKGQQITKKLLFKVIIHVSSVYHVWQAWQSLIMINWRKRKHGYFWKMKRNNVWIDCNVTSWNNKFDQFGSVFLSFCQKGG